MAAAFKLGTTIVPVPEPVVPSADPENELATGEQWDAVEIETERNGMLIGARSLALPRVWVVTWSDLSDSAVLALRTFWVARDFLLLPTGDGGNELPVRWIENEFQPKRLTRGLAQWELTATLMATGALAVA